MKKLILFVAAMLSLVVTNGVKAQDDAMMKAWEKYMTPGDMHTMIAKSDGTWNADVTMWMKPGAPPEKSTGVCENKMILGGRYQQTIHRGTAMGKPFEGMGLMAYDNAKKIFIWTWVDNMGTGVMYLEGIWDEATKTINFKGKSVDPSTGKDMDIREVYKQVDDNNEFMEMYCTMDGKEMKTMEIKFTRQR